ncbi:4-amino-4-deoxy-L-arabinose-phosphoundecaprenol flippase subunit ArnF [Celerinatantimonas yamalensis]|uniref:4-amino-4-deoxy-L-arabinose-phosphoundecaprenol flippase subunit ArnF n=1 Tax=Celerinatantimonas yamalensis TaxID=559956 RepID=A0ABW9GAV3_9GAMM
MTKSWFAIAASVLLVTIAQLTMKLGMSELPPLSWQLLFNLQRLIMHWHALSWVLLGLTCYALSMGCWMLALVKLPLSVAYPCLSISYILVAMSAHWLFAESLSLTTLLGSCLILLGVSLITYRSSQGTKTHQEANKH